MVRAPPHDALPKNGNRRRFVMKLPISANSKAGPIDKVAASSAGEPDS
jgi:hypothetical protein